MSCIVVPPVKAGDETVSSTLIRRKLAEGDIEGASFLLVLHQTVGGTLVACMLCFIVYLPMRRISRAFSRDDRWI